jgi:integrase
MRTEDEPESEPSANRGSTWGVRLLPPRLDRPNPYGVQWPEKVWDEKEKKMVRTVKTLFFPTAEARETKAAQLRDERRSRMMVPSASRTEIEEWRAFKAAIGNTPWQHVVAGWQSRQIETGTLPCTLTVEAAAKLYLDNARALHKRERLSKDYLRHMETKIGELYVGQFGDVMLDKVTTTDIITWLDDIDDIKSDFTFDCYKTHVQSFYSYFLKQENPVIRDNPAKRIRDRSDGIGEVKIITPEQTAQLFWTALNYVNAAGVKIFLPAVGRLAMEAFIGLRFSSGCRLEKKDINREDKGVLLPKKKLKTKRRHYIDGLPEQIWDWYDITPDECWDLTARQYMELKSNLFTVARVPHPHNCLRHNFATYHVAALKNPGRTATILCHRDQDELYDHYKGNATEAQGKLYQLITPATVDEIRRGAVLVPAP